MNLVKPFEHLLIKVNMQLAIYIVSFQTTGAQFFGPEVTLFRKIHRAVGRSEMRTKVHKKTLK